jgi:uncharacterized membrane protein
MIGCLATIPFSWAQEANGGTISGTVVDKFGEPLNKAKVTAKKIDTEGETICDTDEHGAYKLSKLLAGNYRVTAKKNGYMTHTYTDVILGIGKTVKLNIKLDPPGKIFED